MRTAINSTVSAYRTFNTLILVLLGLIIGQCSGLTTLGDILETHHDNFPALAKKVESEVFQNTWSCAPLNELSRAIRIERDGFNGCQIHNHQASKATLFLGDLQSGVLDPIQVSSERQFIGFNRPEDANALHDSISDLRGLVKILMEKVQNNVIKQPPDLKESAGTGLLGNAEDGDLAASDFLKTTEVLAKILQTPATTCGQDALRTKLARIHLNGVLVQFLIIFERHNVASTKWFENLLNKGKGVQIIFNYLARRFPGLRDNINAPNAYLITDFKKALQESPFTAELKELFQHFKHSDWHQLERLQIVSQIDAFDPFFKAVGSRSGPEFRTEFMRLTKPTLLNYVGEDLYQPLIRTLSSSLVKQIGRITKLSRNINDSAPITPSLLPSLVRQIGRISPFGENRRSPPLTQILSLKTLHGMVRFLGRYHTTRADQGEGAIAALGWSKFDASEFQKLDEAITLFSDAIKLVYFEYGQTLKELVGSIYEIDENIPIIYLMDINNSEQLLPNEIAIRTNLNQSPQLPLFQPIILNILKRLEASTKIFDARDRLIVLRGILLHPENTDKLV
ncbi:hypothetical protein PTTG_25359 [Puccinia triticina 1-1 BBBD Race 1]|uniref:Uncharacterized protein n=1 Tax=Puccinia triticina (isolate 1-1 / race 1 (BBBD)) TaxID=630390 RepID=A0A180H3I2_PUCT1|nr:hypothetical protein PTTG_25359 [Puccinia triticina 1-1 BBBD Race 1]